MIYKYIFYKFYQWAREWFDPFAPQISSTLILSLLPLSILYLIVRLAGILDLLQFDMNTTLSPMVISFVVIFALLVLFNQIYFFVYYNWRDIILYFRENEISKSTKIIANVYIVLCTSVYAFLFLFLGYEF